VEFAAAASELPVGQARVVALRASISRLSALIWVSASSATCPSGDPSMAKPTDQCLEHGFFAAMKMARASRIDNDAARRIGCNGRRETLEGPNNCQALQCPGVCRGTRILVEKAE
jgi:hypothetical protein